jgi:hypothetical protein
MTDDKQMDEEARVAAGKEELRRFVAGGDTDKQIEYARRLAEGPERAGAARELTVEAMITELACAGLELHDGSDGERADVRLYLERFEELQRLTR